MIKFNIKDECVRNDFIVWVADLLDCPINKPKYKIPEVTSKILNGEEIYDREKIMKEAEKCGEENCKNYVEYVDKVGAWLIENGYMVLT